MKLFRLVLLVTAAMPALYAKSGAFDGRWDLTVTPKTPAPGASGSRTYPDWMEVSMVDGKTAVRVQPRTGSARYIADFQLEGAHLHFVFSKADEKNPEVKWDLDAAGGKVTGTVTRGGAVFASIAGVHAPKLDRKPPKEWGAAESLFNGKDLTGWEPMSPANSHWTVDRGELLNTASGSNLKSTRLFQDFQLHLEVNCPDKGNSGVYLRGRYEMQVEYEEVDANDKFHSIGSIYSFVAPSVVLPRKPGTWETFDVTLVGRRVTIVRNGVKTIDNQEIAGPTGGALDSNEAEPGPFYIQGDHTGGLRYRNITIQTPKR